MATFSKENDSLLRHGNSNETSPTGAGASFVANNSTVHLVPDEVSVPSSLLDGEATDTPLDDVEDEKHGKGCCCKKYCRFCAPTCVGLAAVGHTTKHILACLGNLPVVQGVLGAVNPCFMFVAGLVAWNRVDRIDRNVKRIDRNLTALQNQVYQWRAEDLEWRGEMNEFRDDMLKWRAESTLVMNKILEKVENLENIMGTQSPST